MNEDSKFKQVHVSSVTHKQLRELAAVERRSMANLVEVLLEKELTRRINAGEPITRETAEMKSA